VASVETTHYGKVTTAVIDVTPPELVTDEVTVQVA